jgi:hypothetical protein
MQTSESSSNEFKILLGSLKTTTPKYEHKGKQYCILAHSKFKSIDLDLIWIDCVVYMCLYDNPDGLVWVRPAKEFYELFKQTDEESKSKEL